MRRPELDASPFHAACREFRRKLLRDTLTAHHGNRTQAARALGLQRTYLLRMLRELGIAQEIKAPTAAQVKAQAAARRNGG